MPVRGRRHTISAATAVEGRQTDSNDAVQQRVSEAAATGAAAGLAGTLRNFRARSRRFTEDGAAMISLFARRNRRERPTSSSDGSCIMAHRASEIDVTAKRKDSRRRVTVDRSTGSGSSNSATTTSERMGRPSTSPVFRTGRARYDFGRVLGVGTFSVVKLVTDRTTGQKWACKVIPLADTEDLSARNGGVLVPGDDSGSALPAPHGVPNRSPSSTRVRNIDELEDDDEHFQAVEHQSTREEIFAEIELLRKLRHPNILYLRDAFEEDGRVYLVTEMLTGGELLRALMERGSYVEEDAREVFRQLLEALKYMHSMGIVHRDVKLENLILANKDDTTTVKLVDFGLAAYLSEPLTAVCGTPQYVAPEVLYSVCGKPYGHECDIWSAGVLLFNLLAGYPPFHSNSVHKVLHQVANGQIDFCDPVWELISPEAIDLLSKLLVMNPEQRISIDEALRHPWMVAK